MILFYQLKGMTDMKLADPHTEEGGKILKMSLEAFCKLFRDDCFDRTPRRKPERFAGNLVNLETGEVISEYSRYRLPEWVKNPLLRAIKVAEFKQQQTNKKKGK